MLTMIGLGLGGPKRVDFPPEDLVVPGPGPPPGGPTRVDFPPEEQESGQEDTAEGNRYEGLKI